MSDSTYTNTQLSAPQYERIGQLCDALIAVKCIGNRHAAFRILASLVLYTERYGDRKITARELGEIASVTYGHVPRIARMLAQWGLITIERTGNGTHDTPVYSINVAALNLPPMPTLLDRQVIYVTQGNKKLRVTTTVEEIPVS